MHIPVLGECLSTWFVVRSSKEELKIADDAKCIVI
jgi:hypothetical protein